jgi:hypothetical protein
MLKRLAATVVVLAACSLAGISLASESQGASLQLESPTGFVGPAAPKHLPWFEDAAAAPASMAKALGAVVFEGLEAEAAAFTKDVEARATAGGGDGDRGAYVLIEVLAFVLGVIPGFGIGHLVGGSIWGFVTWLCVDIVIGIIFFWILPIIVFPAFQYMYTIGVIAVVIERIFEGYSAFRAAYWNYGVSPMSDSGMPHDEHSGMAVNAAPNVASLHF